MNNDHSELSLHELDTVAGGTKSALQAAKGIDLTAFLALTDKAIALAKQI
jgi:hypothetical protein